MVGSGGFYRYNHRRAFDDVVHWVSHPYGLKEVQAAKCDKHPAFHFQR